MTAAAVRAAPLLLASLALSAAAPARAEGVPVPGGDPVVVDRAEVLKDLGRLDLLLHEATSSPGPMAQGRLDEMRARLGALRRAVAAAPAPQPPAAHHPRGRPMDPESFAALLSAVNRVGSSEGVGLVRAAAGGWFLASQVRELVRAVNFSQYQLEVARILRRRVVDTENLWQLYDAIGSTDRGELERILQE